MTTDYTTISLNKAEERILRLVWKNQAHDTASQLDITDLRPHASVGEMFQVVLQPVELRILLATLDTYLGLAKALGMGGSYAAQALHRQLKQLHDDLPTCKCNICGAT